MNEKGTWILFRSFLTGINCSALRGRPQKSKKWLVLKENDLGKKWGIWTKYGKIVKSQATRMN